MLPQVAYVGLDDNGCEFVPAESVQLFAESQPLADDRSNQVAQALTFHGDFAVEAGDGIVARVQFPPDDAKFVRRKLPGLLFSRIDYDLDHCHLLQPRFAVGIAGHRV